MFLGCFFYCFLKKFSFIEVELIYSVVLISVLLFPSLLERPECPTRRPGCRLWVPCWPCLAAPEAASLQEAWKGLPLVLWAEGWLFSSQSPSCPAFPLLEGEQRACGLGQPCRSCGSQVGPGGAALSQG